MLHYYAGENQLKKLRHELHVDSSKVNDRDGNGWTPLHYAAASGQDTLQALQICLEFKADFDLKNRKGETPLHVACAGRHIESAAELIKAGCDYEAKNNEGRAPFDLLDAATRGVWERDRWIRAAISAGEGTRNNIAARIKAEQARLAEERKMKEAARLQSAAEAAAAAEVQAAVDGKTSKGGVTSANVASKRQKYLQVRDQLTVKMKQKKAESVRAVRDISRALDQVRLEEERKRLLDADEKASFRAIPDAATMLEEEEAVHELEVLRHAGALEDEIETRRALIVCEGASQQLKLTALEHEAELAGTQQRVQALQHRTQDLSRLVPVAKLLGAAMRLDRRRIEIQEAAEKLRLERLREYQLLKREEEERRQALLPPEERVKNEVQCVRCSKIFVDDQSNTSTSCRYHKGHKIVLASFGSAFSCCRRMGTGCTMAKHTAFIEEAGLTQS